MKSLFAAFVVAVAALSSAVPGRAQEVDLQKMEVARQIVAASGTGRTFDEVLPNVADQAKATFIRANPQMQLGIIEVVDRVALSMVDRRAELDDRLAELWASSFDKAELEGILQFYLSPAGKKLAEIHPKLLGAQVGVAQEWAQEIGEEIVQKVTTELQGMVDVETKKLEAPAPTGGELKAQ